MRVWELIAILLRTDQDAQVLFLAEHADEDESDEIKNVEIQDASWTFESGAAFGRAYSAIPGRPQIAGLITARSRRPSNELSYCRVGQQISHIAREWGQTITGLHGRGGQPVPTAVSMPSHRCISLPCTRTASASTPGKSHFARVP